MSESLGQCHPVRCQPQDDAPRWMQLNSLAFGASFAAYMAGYLTPYFFRAFDTTVAM